MICRETAECVTQHFENEADGHGYEVVGFVVDELDSVCDETAGEEDSCEEGELEERKVAVDYDWGARTGQEEI